MGETHGTQAERCVGPEGAGPCSGQPRWGWGGPLAKSIRRLKPAATHVRPLRGLHVSLSNAPTERVTSVLDLCRRTDSGCLLVTPPQIPFDLVLMVEIVGDRAANLAQAEGGKIISDLLGRRPPVNSRTTQSSVTRELPMRIDPSSQSVRGAIWVVSSVTLAYIIHYIRSARA